MTGTSLDGIDAALVQIDATALDMRATFLRGITLPLADTGPALRRLAEQTPTTAGEIAALSRDFSLLHARAIRELLAGETCDLISIHGQTVFHKPPASWQLFQPAPIAHEFGTPVVFDLRAMDLAAGGQGAPITPIADWILFASGIGTTCIANLGGFCNITVLRGKACVNRTLTPPAPGARSADPAEIAEITARDVCACNQLLDDVARKVLRTPFDKDGAAALRGTPHEEALKDLRGILAAQGSGKRSLGTGDESGDWVSRWRSHINPEDLAATACEGIAIAIADAARGSDFLWLAGGGVRNAALVKAIRASAAGVGTTDDRGVPAAYREAICFAVLGALCQDRVPITLPKVTGVAKAPISGAWVLP
jgi:1,6-anhydro-N-acetylmuramate kinase